MQHYSAMFEAAIDGVSTAQARSRNLTFEIAGDGNLPRIAILKPTVRYHITPVLAISASGSNPGGYHFSSLIRRLTSESVCGIKFCCLLLYI